MNSYISPRGALCFSSIALAFAVGILIGYRFYYYSPWYPYVGKAVAMIHPTATGATTGIVTFVQQKDGVLVTLECHNLTPGNHGFHIHTYGDARCVGAFCDHFNPTGDMHGGPHSTNRHAGDFGNIIADASGTAHVTFVDNHISLNGPTSIIGRSIIIHADADDLVSQPSGNSGARIAYGVIGLSDAQRDWCAPTTP